MSAPERLGDILAGMGYPRPAPASERDYLAELAPRRCACGRATGSVALSECHVCEATMAHARAVADLYDDGAGMDQPGATQ